MQGTSGLPPLSELLYALCAERKIHICITDLSGVLSYASLNVSPDFKIHSMPFCGEVAKSTAKGCAMCLACKGKANSKAEEGGRPFSGSCYFGINESAYPVLRNGKVICIVYCGNYIISEEYTVAKMKKACLAAGIPENKAIAEMKKSCAVTKGHEPYAKCAALVGEYINRLLDGENVGNKPLAFSSAEFARQCIELEYESDLTLSALAKRLYVNPKHLGRVFSSTYGESFNAALLKLRIQKAKELLCSTRWAVIDVAYSVGFNNVTYFNRIFKQLCGMTPREYRSHNE